MKNLTLTVLILVSSYSLMAVAKSAELSNQSFRDLEIAVQNVQENGSPQEYALQDLRRVLEGIQTGENLDLGIESVSKLDDDQLKTFANKIVLSQNQQPDPRVLLMLPKGWTLKPVDPREFNNAPKTGPFGWPIVYPKGSK